MHEITTGRMATNGIDVPFAECGTGPAVTLLHGWPHDWRLWQNVMPRLAAAGLRATAPELRGCSGSTRADRGYDPETLAEDVAGLLDALGVERTTVVGIDASAPVAFMLAMRHARRVRRLVLSESLLGDQGRPPRFRRQLPRGGVPPLRVPVSAAKTCGRSG